MDIFHREHKKLIFELLQAGVDFMLVGGYAVNIHGYVRATQDMDIWLKPDNVNKLKLTGYLRDQKFDEDGLSFIERHNFEEHFVFHIGEKPMQVDFITRISGVSYDEACEEKMLLPLDQTFVPVIQLHHLVISKTATGRPQDVADIEKLQEIANKRNQKSD